MTCTSPASTGPGANARIGPRVADLARRAEAIGVRTLSFMDHFFQMESFGPARDRCLRVLDGVDAGLANLRRHALDDLVQDTGIEDCHHRAAAWSGKCHLPNRFESAESVCRSPVMRVQAWPGAGLSAPNQEAVAEAAGW